jgi:hypothetical protein
LTLLYAVPSSAAVTWIVRVDPLGRQRHALTKSIVVAALVFALFGSVVRDRLAQYNGNYSGFLLVSARVFDANPVVNGRADIRRSLILTDDGGYDGQFAYFAMFDPLLRRFRGNPSRYREVVDVPPYRFGRIGYSLFARLVAVGHWPAYPQVMIWLVLTSLAVATGLLAWSVQQEGLTPMLGGILLAVPGFWSALQSGLPEPIAAATLIAALLFSWSNRLVPAAAFFAASLLIRETGIVALGCVIAGLSLSGRARQAAWISGISLAPLVLWRLYVGWVLLPDWGISGFFYRPPVGLPVGGIITLWSSIARGLLGSTSHAFVRASIVFPLLLIGGLALAAGLTWKVRTAVNVAALFYAIAAISLVFDTVWIHVGNAQRTTFELFVMLALSVVWIKEYPAWLRSGLAAFWMAAFAYTFWGAYDASYVRETVLTAFLRF